MNKNEIINWLLSGDVSIQYQTYRDLLDQEKPDLQKKIAVQGWGKQFLSMRNQNGHWGQRFYQPKWISTHYTLLDLKNLGIHPDNAKIKNTVDLILDHEKALDGGIDPGGKKRKSDVCINGMVINYASYFKTEAKKLKSLVDTIISQQMADGGFNCCSNRSGAIHSSLHTTISILEGINEYIKNGYKYRMEELLKISKQSEEFILIHRLYKSDKTGEIINKKFLKLTYPCRWYYDILRCLEYFYFAGVNYDERMRDAIDILIQKRGKDGTWTVQAKHPGKVHFEMEKAGKPSRWNTLRVLRVFEHFGIKVK